MTNDMDLAEQIVFELCGPGRVDEWHARLPNRPDWQAAIERIRELLEYAGKPTVLMLPIPEPVRVWYQEKADEMHRTGSVTTATQLMVNTLFLHTVQASRPGGPGAMPRMVNPPYETCPTCGAAVRVVGNSQAYWYEPVHVDDVTPILPPVSSQRVRVTFTPNEYTLLAQDEPADFPSGAGY